MRILTVSALLCALMVLIRADYVVQKVDDDDGDGGEELEEAEEESFLEKRGAGCPAGWAPFGSRCFHFFARSSTWAEAEKFCQTMGANLASVHDILEYQEIQRMMMTSGFGGEHAWIGGSDCQQNGLWLWSDGSRFLYTNWCPGEPNNSRGMQGCLNINHSENKCWDDLQCWEKKPFVCGKDQ